TAMNNHETATATGIAHKMDYPNPPELSEDATVFVCPYCFLSLPSETSQAKKWKSVYKTRTPRVSYADSTGNMFLKIFNRTHVIFQSVHRTIASLTPSKRGKHTYFPIIMFSGDGCVSSAQVLNTSTRKRRSLSIFRPFIEMR